MRSKSSGSATHRDEKEDKFSTFVYAVFVAVVLGAGGVIWSLIKDNASLDRRVAVLESKCAAPLTRGSR